MEHFGYLDPGTGSVLIQAVIGVILAVSVFFRNYIGRAAHVVKKAFGGRKKKTQDPIELAEDEK